MGPLNPEFKFSQKFRIFVLRHWLHIKIQPSKPSSSFVLLQQEPEPNFFITSTTTVRETAFGVKPYLAANPGLQFEISRRASRAIENIPIAEALDIPKVFIGKCNGTHEWDYPFAKPQTWQSAITFPNHSSVITYSSNDPLDAVRFRAETCLETNPKARPSKFAMRPSTIFRPGSGVLSLGYKHVNMCFSVNVKRDVKKELLEFRSRDRGGLVVRLHHKFNYELCNSQDKQKVQEHERAEAFLNMDTV
jgi:hypothetical protein